MGVLTDLLLREMILDIRKEIENESVSYGEIAFLQNHQEFIKEWFADDLLLLQWAGVPEQD